MTDFAIRAAHYTTDIRRAPRTSSAASYGPAIQVRSGLVAMNATVTVCGHIRNKDGKDGDYIRAGIHLSPARCRELALALLEAASLINPTPEDFAAIAAIHGPDKGPDA